MGIIAVSIVVVVVLIMAGVSHLISTQIYKLLADKNRTWAITARVLTFATCFLGIAAAIWFLVIMQITISRG